MKLLVIGASEENYVCFYHEAFRRGLVRLYNTKLYGKGYPGFNPQLQTYSQILSYLYPDGSRPDLILVGYDLAASFAQLKFEYDGLEEIHCPKAILLSDWWKITENYQDAFPGWLQKYGINYLLAQHIRPLREFTHTPVAERFVHFPVCVDPEQCNDWQLPKRYDVGFLGCGISPFHPFYPEREAIHKALRGRADLNYLWKPHPGYGHRDNNHPLTGKNYSQLINQCKLFIATGSRLQNTFGKYFEVPASGSLMLATHADGAVEQGLIDGVNYVKITPENVLEKVDYYLAHPAQAARIAAAGYRWAMSRHSIYARAQVFLSWPARPPGRPWRRRISPMITNADALRISRPPPNRSSPSHPTRPMNPTPTTCAASATASWARWRQRKLRSRPSWPVIRITPKTPTTFYPLPPKRK